MNRRRRMWRPISQFGKSVARRWTQLSQGVNSATATLTSFKEEAVIVDGNVTRRRPSPASFLNPLFWIREAVLFVGRYLRSRHLVAAIQGIPAMIGMIIPVSAAIWFSSSVDDRTAEATAKMRRHLNRDQLEEADFYARQLCFLAPNDPTVLLARAQLLDRMEREDEARDIALQLATEHESISAIEWLSEKELRTISSPQGRSVPREQQLESWLTWIIERQPDHVRANFMLGTLQMMRGQHIKAIPPFRTVADQSAGIADRDEHLLPETWYSLAECYSVTGETTDSRRFASFAADALIERDALSAFDMNATMRTLRALILAARENDAALLIRETMRLRQSAGQTNEVEQLQWLLGEVYAQLCKRLRMKERRQARDVAEAVEALQKALAAAPGNPVVEEELVAFACTRDLDAHDLERQLTVAQDSGVSPGLIHFIRGTRAITATPPDQEAASQQFELAMKHNSNYPGLLNNLADAMAESEDADMDAALQFVNEALAMMPNQPHFHDTRGKIYLRQGQTLDAIAEFELALAAPELRATVHAQLARAWESLGNDAESARHRTQADNLADLNARERQAQPLPGSAPPQQTPDPSP